MPLFHFDQSLLKLLLTAEMLKPKLNAVYSSDSHKQDCINAAASEMRMVIKAR